MKVIKRAICLIVTVLIFALGCAPPVEARAASDGRIYARADLRNVYFCQSMDLTTALFAIPYTYCVEIITDHGEWYLVKYAQDDGFYRAVTGYCKKEGLTVVDQPPQNIYLSYPVYATLRADVDSSLPGLEITVTAAYYGVYYRGAAAYSYVLYDNCFRYVAGANEDYPLNEIPSEPTFSPTDPTPQDDGSRLATALIITAIAAAAIVILIITGKQKVK